MITVQRSFKKMMLMMMNCFCGMVDRRKTCSLIFSQDHSQRSSPLRISDTLRAEFEPAQNFSSGLVEWSCAVVITTTPRRHKLPFAKPHQKPRVTSFLVFFVKLLKYFIFCTHHQIRFSKVYGLHMKETYSCNALSSYCEKIYGLHMKETYSCNAAPFILWEGLRPTYYEDVFV